MWIYIQTYIVYFFLAFIMTKFGQLYVKTNKYKYIVEAICIYSLVFAFRYGVGGDYFNYYYFFKELCDISSSSYSFEQGFIWFSQLIAYTGSQELFFGILAFLPLFFYIYRLKDIGIVYPYVLFSFVMLGSWLGFSNTLRQTLAVGLWIYALKYAIEKKLIMYSLIVVLATTIHTSSVILFPLYFIFRYSKEIFHNLLVETMLLIGAIILMNINIVQQVISQLDLIIRTVGYSSYLDYYSSKLESDVNLGVGFYLGTVLNIVLVIYSNKVKVYFNSNYYNLLYDVFFIGVICHYIFINSIVFGRINMFFYSHLFIIAGVTLCYAFYSLNKKLQMILSGLIILSLFGLLYRASENWTLFVFNWQDQFYYLHKLHDFGSLR